LCPLDTLDTLDTHTLDTSDAGASPRRAVFATAGHVDHGKTALIRALTGVDTDRLPEEKRRGITLELGFAELPGTPISFIDVPGHRRLVHAMIAGASGVDALVLAVAAGEGVMPQTREHLHVAALLGIRRVLVALTKAELVDDETLALAEADVREALSAVQLSAVSVHRTSARTGRGMEELRSAVVSLAETLPDPGRTARTLLPVDRVFNVQGAGVVVTGTLVHGRLRVGQPVRVLGRRGPRTGVCRGLEIHGRATAQADAPARVAVNIARLERDDLERGDIVSGEHAPCVSRRLDVSLQLLPGVTVKDDQPAVVHVGAARAAARLLMLGSGFAQLVLHEPLAALGGLAFVVRGFSPNREHGAVLGGGRILDADAPPLPRPRDTAGRSRRVHAVELCRDGRQDDAVLAMLDEAPRPVDGAALESRLGLEPGTIAEWSRRDALPGVVSVDAGSCWTTARGLERLAELATARVEAHQASAPHERGASLETIRSALAERCGRDAADAALHRALAGGRLRVEKGVLSTPEFAEREHAASDQAALAALAALERAALQGMGEDAFVASGTPLTVVRAALARLATSGRARRLGALWFAEGAIEEARVAIRAHFERGLPLSVADFKALCRVSRKQAIPLLEQLDREGTTLRDRSEQGRDIRLAGPLLRE